MHVIVGLAGLIAVLGYTMAGGHAHAFTGLFYVPAVVLLVAAPPFIAITSYRFEELFAALKSVLHALQSRPSRSRERLFDDLVRFASEVRARRPAEALAVAERSSHDLLRQLAPLVVKQYATAAIESTSKTATYCLASGLKRSEEVFTTLARVAPAVGLVGTVMGLIALLKDLSKFDQLGPSMALALLCTLYGLLLANALYQPIARLLHSHALVMLEEAQLLTRALVLVGEGKPVADVRNLFAASGSPDKSGASGDVVPLDRRLDKLDASGEGAAR